MAKILEFTVHTVPVPQPRHRAGFAGGKPKMFLPSGAKIHDFKSDLKKIVREQYDGPVLSGPIRLSCLFLMPRPKDMVWKKRPMQRVPHVKKPDADNLLKGLKDALKGILWRDDSQVWVVHVVKEYHAGDESPRVSIKVMED